MARGRGERVLDWAAVLLVGIGATVALDLLAVPSAALFGGLVAGLGRALLGTTPLALPRPAGTGAQAVIGVSIGALIQADTLRTVADHWLPVLLITVATLAVSLVAGQLMRLQPGVTPVTGAFSMIAGGASGITAMARDLGADAQVVAVLQYLRVLLIVTAMPIVATTVYGASGNGAASPTDDGPGWPAGLLFTVVCVVVGVLLGRVSRLPVGALLGPLAVAAVLDVTGLSQGATVPPPVEAAGFLAIGLQVGLGFTRANLRLVGRALPLAVVLIVGAVAACAGLGVLLSRTAGVSALDGYLATTPGGLYAVLATATGSGADATFVLAVQVLRLFVMLFSAPLLARWLGRGQQPA
ncbi:MULTISPECIES: AbrB family transcriptional regulator [unclassified Modestobacter]|uniref:AbrB family transcriptional regulator n=1 Tax=unclassified Modestobacter TaxID=2643866 RepID=UPI0022AA184B|nr:MULTISPECIES: AbrB family transcriptional regulator [unclassified Modestobacter]MCZ2825420.1 AbrB family transcriptional regulator [Modestobacter sp. VKM Ac-2981]MCZ2853515.1 AbrB family transcriptional regulator [Modestobacter sp. VKM Ac-2982]